MFKYIAIPIGILTLLASCQKEIDIDLNAANPRYVIEGGISNVAGNARVRITRTLNFSDTQEFPTVSGALVTLTDQTTNHIDTLPEIAAGIYADSTVAGTSGHTYRLTVKVGSEVFESTSTMPQQVDFTGLTQLDYDFGGGDLKFLTPEYIDPAGVANYYNFVITLNDTTRTGLYYRDDANVDGDTITTNAQPVIVEADSADVLIMDMQCIDKAMYEYLFGLDQTLGQSSATPANPPSNINNNALGYFKAYTSQRRTIVLF